MVKEHAGACAHQPPRGGGNPLYWNLKTLSHILLFMHGPLLQWLLIRRYGKEHTVPIYLITIGSGITAVAIYGYFCMGGENHPIQTTVYFLMGLVVAVCGIHLLRKRIRAAKSPEKVF